MTNTTQKSTVPLEATHLRDRTWAGKPANQLGTCGWYPYPWTVMYIKAGSKAEAERKAYIQRGGKP